MNSRRLMGLTPAKNCGTEYSSVLERVQGRASQQKAPRSCPVRVDAVEKVGSKSRMRNNRIEETCCSNQGCANYWFLESKLPCGTLKIFSTASVKSGSTHNEPMMSAFHPIATELADISAGPSCAISGSRPPHSITSSARVRSEGGTLTRRRNGTSRHARPGRSAMGGRRRAVLPASLADLGASAAALQAAGGGSQICQHCGLPTAERSKKDLVCGDK
jgi:hypothetical protein